MSAEMIRRYAVLRGRCSPPTCVRIPPFMITARLLAFAGIVTAFTALSVAATPLTPVPPQAQLRIAAVQVRVAPDHRDWTYVVGEPAKFRVTVTADNTPLDNVTVSYTVGPELQPLVTQTAAVPLDGLVIDGGTMKQPGFLRCSVSVEFAGKTYKGAATAAFSPEKIQPTQTEPDDFDAFWQKGKDELAKVPLDARLTLLPEQSSGAVNVYHVSFRTVGDGWNAPARIYGILCEPKKPGKYPAVLQVPGAGVRPYSGDKDLAARGAIVLQIGIHGIPVNLGQEVYDQLLAGGLNGYWLNGLDDRERFYYRRVNLSCVRANDFLTSRESWNGKDLLVMGASQGGQLSIATAALDRRVTGIAVTHPAFCDVTGPLHGRAGGWPHPFRSWDGHPTTQATPEKIGTTRYYDTVNFARRVKVPGFYNWGYNDDVCPPTSIYAAYNVITAPKTLGLTLQLAHDYTPEQWEAINGWVVNFLGLAK
jgi:cephalosporin-C deacetylase